MQLQCVDRPGTVAGYNLDPVADPPGDADTAGLVTEVEFKVECKVGRFSTAPSLQRDQDLVGINLSGAGVDPTLGGNGQGPGGGSFKVQFIVLVLQVCFKTDGSREGSGFDSVLNNTVERFF